MAGAPEELGYTLAADWRPQRALWLGASDAAGLTPFVSLAGGQPLDVIASDATAAARQVAPLSELGAGRTRIGLGPCPSPSLRIVGPLFLSHSLDYPPSAVDWPDTPPLPAASRCRSAWIAQADRRTFVSPVALPPAALESNGEGLILASRAALEACNPGRPPQALHDAIVQQLGASQVVWLEPALSAARAPFGLCWMDHLARFVSPRTVLVVSADRGAADYRALRDNTERLRETHDSRGRPLRVVVIRRADESLESGVGPLAFAVLNRAALAPLFDAPPDFDLLQALADAWPEREIRGQPAGPSASVSPYLVSLPEPVR